MPEQQIFHKTNKKEHFNLVIYEKHGRHFELFVDPDKVIEYRNGNKMPLKEVLKVDKIYTLVRQGLISTNDDLLTVFNTIDFETIAKKILEDGKLQLSQSYRKSLIEKTNKKIINDIHRLAIDARTNLPLPFKRIENALLEVKFKVKEGQAYDKMFKEAMNLIKTVIPIKITNIRYGIYLKFKYSDRVLKFLTNIGDILKKNVHQDELYIVVEIASGLKEEFMDGLNSITHGNVKIDVMK